MCEWHSACTVRRVNWPSDFRSPVLTYILRGAVLQKMHVVGLIVTNYMRNYIFSRVP